MQVANLFKHWTYQVFSPGTILRSKYEAFKELLRHDKRSHELMAELEDIYHNQNKVDFKVIEDKCDGLCTSVSAMIDNFTQMCPTAYPNLRDYFKKVDFYIRFMFFPPEFDFSPPYTIPIEEIPLDALNLVGGKALNLAKVARAVKLPTPKGFSITTNAFYYFIEFNDLRGPIDERLSKLDIYSTASLDAISRELMEMIVNAQIPANMEEAILSSFDSLHGTSKKRLKVAVRSSAVAEDAKSSFAGQYRTVLNVERHGILDAYKQVLASKYGPRALYYRINYGLSDLETPMSVFVLEMVNAKASGVIYTEDLEEEGTNNLAVHSIWGLGELLVGGEISPDIFTVSKDKKPVIRKRNLGDKSKKMVFSEKDITEVLSVTDDKKGIFSLDDDSVLTLSEWGTKLEDYYKESQDIEWAMDEDGRLLILQSRSLHKEETGTEAMECSFEHIENPVLISGGERASSGIGAGKVFRIQTEEDLEKVPQNAVLVARNALPHYVKVMDKLSAVVTDVGSTAGHFSSVAREFGVPTLVNTRAATEKVPHGKEVTVFSDGKVVYEGIVKSMLESPCARRDLISDSPFIRKLKYIMSFISPLRLVDPQSPKFAPEGCRSLHDIIRFLHEKAINDMFSIGDRRGSAIKGARKLTSSLPILLYVVDVGDGLEKGTGTEKHVSVDQVTSIPLKAVWKGFSHPGVHWSEFTHFDWQEFDNIVMSGGIISKDSPALATYAVISHDYLNLNMKFGYHFVILDAMCGDDPSQNYISFRFAGGGGQFYQRALRVEFMARIFSQLEFKVDRKGDLLDVQLTGYDKETIKEKLDIVGRLMGATRLMDMYLKDASMVQTFVDAFMAGRYDFATVREGVGPQNKEKDAAHA